MLLRLLSFVFSPLLLLSCWFLQSNSNPASVAWVLPFPIARQLRLSAHRGFSAVAPENTIPAILRAGEAGFFAAEFDIHETKDGAWIVNHDDTVDAMTNGTGAIRNQTLAELQALRIDAGAQIYAYPGLRLPTLGEALEACRTASLRPEIEVKSGSTAALQRLVTELTTRNLSEQAILISFDSQILQTLHTLAPRAEYWWLCSELTSAARTHAQQMPWARVAFNANAPANTTARILQWQHQGIALAAWTIDDPFVLLRCAWLGITHITTNRFTPA